MELDIPMAENVADIRDSFRKCEINILLQKESEFFYRGDN